VHQFFRIFSVEIGSKSRTRFHHQNQPSGSIASPGPMQKPFAAGRRAELPVSLSLSLVSIPDEGLGAANSPTHSYMSPVKP